MKTKKKLAVKQFVKKFSGIPWDMSEIAYYILSDVEDGSLRDCAASYIQSELKLQEALEEAGFEFG